jgi:hypothetical protein
MNRYCILLGTNLDEEGMRGSTKDFVRAGIGRSEGRMGRRGTNEDIGSVEEGRRYIRRGFGGR